MNERDLKRVVEVVLLTAERPLPVDEIAELVSMDASVGGQAVDDPGRQALRNDIRVALSTLGEECAERGIELSEVASGFRFQVKASFAHWVSRLYAERPARYSRALLETLALVAYRQPVTRGEIEDIRGVGVSASIMKTLHEREWIRVLGHREVPGRPAMYGTTRKFLDDFNLKRLDDLPPLAELRDLENLHADLFASEVAVSVDHPTDGASGPTNESADESLREPSAKTLGDPDDDIQPDSNVLH
jgi:segregation and condensation protein B